MKARRVDKRVARRLHGSGQTVYCIPCKYRVPNEWFALMRILPEYDFDSFVNEATYYNCSWETGYYLAYYIKGEEEQ